VSDDGASGGPASSSGEVMPGSALPPSLTPGEPGPERPSAPDRPFVPERFVAPGCPGAASVGRFVSGVASSVGRFVCVSTSPSGIPPRRPTPPRLPSWSRGTSTTRVSPLWVTSIVTVPPGSLRVLKFATPTNTLHSIVAAPRK